MRFLRRLFRISRRPTDSKEGSIGGVLSQKHIRIADIGETAAKIARESNRARVLHKVYTYSKQCFDSSSYE